jgi:hypothetical protein
MKPAQAEVTVGLAMIVKNEARTLPRLAATLEGQIDYWTIVDTGSTDDTVAVANECFSGVPGSVFCDEWRGYGPSRNVALSRTRPHCDWVLTMDADETLHGTIEVAVAPDIDGIEAECRVEPLRYWVPRLVRSGGEWEWRARAHEYLTLPDGPGNMARTTSFYVAHHHDGGNRATKFERELALLEADHHEDPEDPRTVFYIARTHEDRGDAPSAAKWYARRVAMQGWVEENWYSQWRLGCCLLAAEHPDEGCGALWKAWGSRPWRAEPLWSLAEHYRISSGGCLTRHAASLKSTAVSDPRTSTVWTRERGRITAGTASSFTPTCTTGGSATSCRSVPTTSANARWVWR